MNRSQLFGRSRGLAGVVAACAAIAAPAAAQAAPPNPSWTCSAHAATVNLGGASGATLDPLHANTAADAPCRDDGTTLPLISAKDVLGPDTATVTSGNAQAQTGLNNAGAPTYEQAPAAAAQLSNTYANIGGASGLTVTAKLVRSYVYGQCRGATPFLGTPDGPDGGEVLDLRVNGTPVPAEGEPDKTLTQIADGLSPLAPIVRIVLNKTYTGTDPATGETYFRREAVRVELLTAPGSEPVATIVLGSATVDLLGDVCATPAGTTGPGTGDNPVVAPPPLLSGGNEPGSSGGSTGAANGGSTGATKVSGAGGSKPDNGKNASECVHLRMFFDVHRGTHLPHTGPKSLTSHRGTREVVRGRIVNCKGKPIIHAKIDQIHLVGKHRRLVKTGLRSRGDGQLTVILPNNLTTRRIAFRYRPFLKGTKVAARKVLRIHMLPGHYRGYRR
jgi:hypothetical protein